ncbi:WGR domain-containing protein [Pacificimonas flava]|uniref:WGR domain-containing protein n=1 Tax=Pacificimonas flava TaxID=1234595 RepID=UPI0004AF3D1D|nr:WGR domain-containing protein [Pacificimonas flava]MBB5281759.1 putative DNA-binding WGR domain protein [Pacificimonas flava]
MFATLPFEPLVFRAISRDGRIARHYEIEAAYDLFGGVIVETRWGRIGQRYRECQRFFASEEEAASYVRAILDRRASAERRIGVPYRVF